MYAAYDLDIFLRLLFLSELGPFSGLDSIKVCLMCATPTVYIVCLFVSFVVVVVFFFFVFFLFFFLFFVVVFLLLLFCVCVCVCVVCANVYVLV